MMESLPCSVNILCARTVIVILGIVFVCFSYVWGTVTAMSHSSGFGLYAQPPFQSILVILQISSLRCSFNSDLSMFSWVLSALLAAVTISQLIVANYTLSDTFTSANIFYEFSFFNSPDPTKGFVQYTDFQTAASHNLFGIAPTADNAAYIGVEHSHPSFSPGRPSVRLTSKKAFNQGLFIADISHMPGGICGVWPAFWLLGPYWPKGGEIDIIEGVNAQTTNSMTLHTDAGCTLSESGFSGEFLTSNCDVKATGQAENAGCGISHRDPNSYGAGFNENGGGVYATEWTSSAIKIWFFPRTKIPDDIPNGVPNPSNWGTPSAWFGGNCDIKAHFQNMQIVIDTTFCGAWAGEVWKTGLCAKKAKTCEEFVANNPEVFEQAYWLIDSIKVYQYDSKSRR